MVRHQRRPGIGPLAGWRGDGTAQGRGAPNPDQIERYIANGGFWTGHVPEEAAYFKPWNAAYQDWAVATGLIDSPQPFLFQLYAEPLARFQAAALGKGDRQPPDALRDTLARAMAPLPVWYPPPADAGIDPAGLPAPRHHPAPGRHVPLLGLAERLAPPDPRREPALRPRPGLGRARLRARRLGRRHLAARPHHRPGRPHGRAERRHRLDLERHRQAPRRLGARPRAPPRPPAASSSTTSSPSACPTAPPNSDPVTGQAAWYDLRVRLERVPARSRSAPQFLPQASPGGRP